jgi:hypothetical protein
MKSFLIDLAKVLLRAALTETVRRGLPEIYKRLDAEVPLLLTNNAPPSRVAGTVASAIADVSGKRATPNQVAAVLGLYDPVRAAMRGPH